MAHPALGELQLRQLLAQRRIGLQLLEQRFGLGTAEFVVEQRAQALVGNLVRHFTLLSRAGPAAGASASWSRSADRARDSRLITVPTGMPRISAASE